MPKYCTGMVWGSIRLRSQEVGWYNLIWTEPMIASCSVISWLIVDVNRCNRGQTTLEHRKLRPCNEVEPSGTGAG
ncbi:hypothetical protein LINPERPRIM_LOCUS226 [Linum perenne]